MSLKNIKCHVVIMLHMMRRYMIMLKDISKLVAKKMDPCNLGLQTRSDQVVVVG